MIFTVKGPIFFQFLDIFIEVIYFFPFGCWWNNLE